MKSFKRLVTSTVMTGLTLGIIAAVGFVSPAKAASCFTVDSTGAGVTSTTPVFNNICNAPYSIGSEADFVRIRQSSNGNNQDNVNNPQYKNSITSACTAGTKFDVWNYVHNDASQDFNNNGTGSAVAHNVKLAMTAPLGTTSSNFTFGGTVTASNAASVSDTATLTCDSGKQVKLTMVPSTVHLYNSQYGWKILPDTAVNGTTPIGSPTFGSGDVWGCWDYRVVVVYTVTVTDIPVTPTASGTCDLFTVLGQADRKAVVNQFKYTVNNATLTKTVIAWGEGNTTTTVTDATKVIGQSHTYGADGTYHVVATLTFASTNGATITPNPVTCASDVTFSSTKPPVTPPTVLPSTGAGSMIGLFAGVSAAGATAFHFFNRRRLGNQ